jgi:uncharacterized membrane protein YeaQ/YmgE (transglycosylase-associated protein family)
MTRRYSILRAGTLDRGTTSLSISIRCLGRRLPMNMSGESLLVILIVGIVAGWLAGQIVRGAGFGLIGDLIIGILGAFIGSWLLPKLGIHLGAGIVRAIINATLGAIVLLLIIRLVRGGGFARRY